MWSAPDPLDEGHFDVSPFAYVLNNPIMFIDSYGLKEYDPNKMTPDDWKKFDPNADNFLLNEVNITNGDKAREDCWYGRIRRRDGQTNSFIDLISNFGGSSNSRYRKNLDLFNQLIGEQTAAQIENIQNNYGKDVSANQGGSVGEPGFGESLIPIWGSGRSICG